MRSAHWDLAAALLLLLGCGGRSRDASSTAGSTAGESATGAGASGGSDATASAGAMATTDEAGAAGSVADAGSPSMAYDSLILSGTRRCENAEYCFGLACYAPDTFGPTVCVAPCETDANCQASEVCLHAPKLEGTCYQRCKLPDDCYYGFACYDFSGEGELACLPSPWALRRDELGYD